MLKLRKKIKTKADFNNMMKLLTNHIKENKSISDNGMIDGLTIGFMFSTPCIYSFIRGEEQGKLLDATIQRLEQITIWIINNEKEILNLLKNKQLTHEQNTK